MTAVYAPNGRLGANLGVRLDREPHMRLVQAVIAWAGHATLPPGDCDQIALQLTEHARTVAAEVRRCCSVLLSDAEPRVLAEVVLEEADRRLAQRRLGTVRCVQMRVRQVRALYERLDRLQVARAVATPP
ncbi:restriction endonuclease [Streptomyces sp. NBC_01525]|uniref:restriction endonuclease n=1 Tax=Streptomyces sp. NBC_01525 TaxID=2903893 RepID=UPI00386E3B30